MRGSSRAVFGALVTMLALVVAAPPVLAATTITEPSGKTVTVGVDADHYPAPLTISARGFEPYASVFVEQCDGRTPEDDDWAPEIDCDFGSAPAAAVADENGSVTFAASDRNHAFRPFVGPSPQRTFNCLGPDTSSPKNDLPDFRDCQVRVSTNNTRSTGDQVFIGLKLPNDAKPWSESLVPAPVAARNPGTGTGSGAGASARHNATGSNSAGGDLAASSHSASSDSDGGLISTTSLGGLLLVVAALAVGAFFVLRRRRTRRVAA